MSERYRPQPRPRRTFQPQPDALGDRTLLSGIVASVVFNQLRVDGSSLGDNLRITVRDATLLVVGYNSSGFYSNEFPRGLITGIVVDGRAGDDIVVIDDSFTRRPLNTTILGGEGNDDLTGGRIRDLLLGGPGHDRLVGGAGDDRLSGGDGHDLLLGGTGHDENYGDSGDDRIQITGSGVASFSYGGPGADRFLVGTGPSVTLNKLKVKDYNASHGDQFGAFS